MGALGRSANRKRGGANHASLYIQGGRSWVMFPPSNIPPAGSRGLYQHTADLLTLDLCRSSAITAHPRLSQVHTPLVSTAWEVALAAHPNRAFVRFLLHGIRWGFRIGFHRSAPLRSATRNMHSAVEHPEVVRSYLEKECSLGRMLGPFPPSAWPSLPPCISTSLGSSPRATTRGSGA